VNARALKERAPSLAQELGMDFIDFGVFEAGTLARVPPTVFWYEAREGHRILWGNPDALSVLPRMDPRRLPLIEGTRLLTNRGLALLWAWLHLDEALRRGRDLGLKPRRFVVNAIEKAVLAAGDAVLIRAGDYHFSYRERQRRLSSASIPVEDREGFLKAHEASTSFKLYPRIPADPPIRLAHRAQIVTAWLETVFRWIEEGRLKRPIGPWGGYPDRLAWEAAREAVRHPRRFWKERRVTPELKGWARVLLNSDRAYQARLPLLLFGARALEVGGVGFPEGCSGQSRDTADGWRQAASALLEEWHP
jgi:hypothetical protein